MVPLLLPLIAAASAQSVLLLDQREAIEEARFQQELALSVDDARVQAAPADFSAMPLPEQLDWVRPWLQDDETLAVAWLDLDDAATLRLAVAFVSEDRAVVRVLELPRGPGAEARLALAARELIAEAYQLDEAAAIEVTENQPSTTEAPEPWAWTLSAGMVWPPRALAGGPRLAASAGLERALAPSPLWLGAALDAQANAEQRRLGPRLSLRWGPLSVGGGADWVALPWMSLWQPRATVQLSHALPAGAFGALSLALTPLRDEVFAGGPGTSEAQLYDSGWVELGLKIGWQRKVGGR